MEFLLHITVEFEPDQDELEREQLLADEHAAAQELRRRGQLVRIWRVPGSTANWGVWEAADATHLHQIVSSLPLFPFMRIAVHPLAVHPLEAGSELSPRAEPLRSLDPEPVTREKRARGLSGETV